MLTWPLSPVLQKSKLKLRPHQAEQEDSTKFIVLTLISVAAILGVLLASGVIYCLRHSSHYRLKEKLSGPGGHAGLDATAYQVKETFLLSDVSIQFISRTDYLTASGPSPIPTVVHFFIVWVLLW